MPSLLEQAQQHVDAALEKQTPALTLVVWAKRFHRAELVAWTITRCMAQLPGREFHALYVARDLVMLEAARTKFDRLPKGPRFRDQGIYEARSETPPPLLTVNYATIDTAVKVAGHLPTEELDLLILDERAGSDMNRLAGFTAPGAPTFTLAMTRLEPWSNWAWLHLGQPIKLRGEAPLPEAATT